MTDTPRTYWNGNQLLAAEFPEPRWAVPGVVAEGVNILAGAPKLGKSWLALNIGIAVATGGHALGKVKVDQGGALVLALEDTARRLQDRTRKLLGDERPDLSHLHLFTDWPRAQEGGLDQIAATLTKHPGIRLVVVDVLAKFRQPAGDKTNAYQADYDAVSGIKTIADTHGVSALILHHTRKAAADDWLDTVSGTQGIAGAADTLLVMRRSRHRADAELMVTGRDVDEAEHALTWDPQVGLWTIEGSAADWRVTSERQQIIEAVTAGGGLRPKQIAEATGLSHDVVKHLVRKMVDAEPAQLDTDGEGTYLPIPYVHPVHSLDGEGDHGVQSERGYGEAVA